MDMISDIFALEGRALIKQLAHQVEHGEIISSFSPSVYDTAWLAMIRKAGDSSALLFPECLKYLLKTQGEDGGWPEYASELDGILNTMAATVAFKLYEQRPELHNSSFPADFALRILKAERYLRRKLQSWDFASSVHVGFEILVPALLELLEKGGDKFEFAGRPTLMALNQSKLAKFRPDILYSKHKTTLVHSLEAFVGKIDFDKVSHHIDEHGSMMASPSATAAYLIHCSKWNESAERYLRRVVTLGSGKGTGGVPSAFPSSIFETSWIASTLLKAGLSPEKLGLEEIGKIGAFLNSQLESQGGVVGFDSGLLADVDDTAKSIVATNLLGFHQSPLKMIQEFEGEHHFRTYKGERNESLSANCNVLDALLSSSDSPSYLDSIVKVARFLCKVWYAGHTQDKWNLSQQYSMMLLSQTLAKLLQEWDSGKLPKLPEDLLRDQIPLVLFQICIRTLEAQSSDGSWGLNAPSREITAYAILALKTVSSLPWLAHFKPQILKAVKQGSAFLVMHYDDRGSLEHIWIEKVTYALHSLSKTYSIAALYMEGSFRWGERATNLAKVSGEKVIKLAKFFSQLPMFSEDESWCLEADVTAGMLFLPQLIRISADIFPSRQEKINYKYLEYIPFTWISTNRHNGYPLSNDLLWETMKIALLDYQLDEFMETVYGKDDELNKPETVRSIVRRLCEFPCAGGDSVAVVSGQVVSNNDDLNGSSARRRTVKRQIDGNLKITDPVTLEPVEAVLLRFTSYIFQHPKVIQSPDHIRRQIHRELETCMLAHIDHEEDNARFYAQQREQEASSESSHDSPSSPGIKIIPFNSPRSNYYSWVRNTSADNTHSPFTYLYFSCLAAPNPGEPFFQGVRQHYFSNALSRHLANICRQYNDYGSVARDQAESNVNSLNFPEFHEPYRAKEYNDNGTEEIRDESAMKKDLFLIAEYERECLDNAIEKLDAEMRISKQGMWKSKALRSFISTVDLYGQIYVARDITNRVK